MGGGGSLGQCPYSWPVTAMTHGNDMMAVLRNWDGDVIEDWEMWNRKPTEVRLTLER